MIPVSFGRRTLLRSAQPPQAPATNPDRTRADRHSRSPPTRHCGDLPTLMHAPVHRSDPSARCDHRARPADGSAALGCPLQHPRLPDVDEASALTANALTVSTPALATSALAATALADPAAAAPAALTATALPPKSDRTFLAEQRRQPVARLAGPGLRRARCCRQGASAGCKRRGCGGGRASIRC